MIEHKVMTMSRILLALLATAVLAMSPTHWAHAQAARSVLLPHPAWDCGMPQGIPAPEAGALLFEITIPLDRVADVGQTQYGNRRVAVGLEGSVTGPRLNAAVMPGALDFELTLANGTVEIEQNLVLKAADGTYIYMHNAGAGANAKDVRVVLDFEAPNAGEHAWLHSGTYVARRELNVRAKVLRLRVYDTSSAVARTGKTISIVKPAGVPAQPWGYRLKDAGEQQGAMLIQENVTLAPAQSVGPSKHGIRNIIPITGGTVTGRINGKVLNGGADYQHLTPPATIDAHYLWQADDGEFIIVRNGGSFGGLVPTFEARVNGAYRYLNAGRYLSSNPSVGQGGVALTFYESTR